MNEINDEKSILSVIRQTGFSLRELTKQFPELEILKCVPQNPRYHGEGDVYRHTELVCRELVKPEPWAALTEKEQELLFLAGAFHDIGKASCTRMVDGNWTSPRHTMVGEQVFRAMAYRQQERFGLTWKERETVARLIRSHGLPVWFWKRQHPEKDILKAAQHVPMELLSLLAQADSRGRQCEDPGALQEYVELFDEYIRELGVSRTAYPFANAWTRYQYFHKDSLGPGSQLYDDTEFDVWMMCGLPLSGKDTWIAGHGEGRPVISLDDIRQEYGISPRKSSSKAAHIAIERAKQLLRRKEPFIWSATNLMQETRQRLCGLFSGYGARVRLVYLEVPYRELLRRNEKRERYVPVKVLEQMIDRLEMPASWEGYTFDVYT